MEFRTVALIGAGAVGAFFIRGLSNVLGNNFCVIAEGERAERFLYLPQRPYWGRALLYALYTTLSQCEAFCHELLDENEGVTRRRF